MSNINEQSYLAGYDAGWIDGEAAHRPAPPVPVDATRDGEWKITTSRPVSDDDYCATCGWHKRACQCNSEPAAHGPGQCLPLDEHERVLTQVIEERDAYHDWADKLAYAIAPQEWIGEHSSANSPWENALEYAHDPRACLPVAQVEALRKAAALVVEAHGSALNGVRWATALEVHVSNLAAAVAAIKGADRG